MLLDLEGPAVRGASWMAAASVPDLHAQGLRGTGQVVGIGDTGLNTGSCAFSDATMPVPINEVGGGHRKIAAYFTVNGDAQDGPSGHGSHVAGAMAGESPTLGLSGNGLAPAARIAVVDVEHASYPGRYRVPDSDIGGLYFDLFRHAGASTVCSPWSFEAHPALEADIDRYVWEHPEFLPVFPSGNTVGSSSSLPHAPCGAKNVLCVGASFNARDVYLALPSFVHTALRAEDASCAGSANCGEEFHVLAGAFGSTRPLALEECQAAAQDCLRSKAACPECAYSAAALNGVTQARITAASPSDGCSALAAFPRGHVCLVQRGSCNFETKALMCQAAGAVGVVVANGGDETLMVGSSTAAATLTIPVVLAPEATTWQLSGRLVTFPLVQEAISPLSRAPYSAHGAVAGGRSKPELIFPGDNIVSVDASLQCGMRYMSGTSQSCGFGAGAVALAREHLQGHAAADAHLARPWASTLRAVLAVAADAGGRETVWREDVGFGLPVLGRALAPGSHLIALQSRASGGQTQRFCFTAGAAVHPDAPPSIVLAWTDPPDAAGAVVNDLDLTVECLDDWRARLGNDKIVTPDRLNTVEKVALRVAPGTLCVASVSFPRGAPATEQPFALVAAGFAAHSPGFEAALVHPACREHGVAVLVGDGPTWACSCQDGWFGPLCQQRAAPLEFAGGAAASTALPWQWEFHALQLCGAGEYRLEVQGGDLAVVASTAPGVHMWSTSAAQGRGLRSSEGLAEVVVDAAGAVTLRLAAAAGAAAAVPAPEQLYIGVFNRGREGAADYSVRWVAGPAACGHAAPAAALRGAVAQDETVSAVRVLLYCVVALLAAGLLVAARCFCVRRRRLAKVVPDNSMTTAPSSAASMESVSSITQLWPPPPAARGASSPSPSPAWRS